MESSAQTMPTDFPTEPLNDDTIVATGNPDDRESNGGNAGDDADQEGEPDVDETDDGTDDFPE